MKGIVFDIKEFSLHDGPGPRTTVFLKGCPLRCTWCHNPEGLKTAPELMIKRKMCTGCGRCKIPCEHNDCKKFSRCIHACPNGLITPCGTEYESGTLVVLLKKNLDFYEQNGGGITFSGGEPLMQADFLLEVLQKLNCHTAIQTSGYAPHDVFCKVISAVDFVMMDIKLADRELHKKYTGVYNDIILKNFDYLKFSKKEYVIRTPLIPDICDTEENLAQIKKIIGTSKWEKLPQNEFWQVKYSMLD